MKISIIIPISKPEPEFQMTLAFIARQKLKSLNWSEIELIIVANKMDLVDDKLLDNIKAQTKKILCEMSGPGLFRNLGAKNAKGEFLFFLDSDCLPPPYWIENFYHRLQKDKLNFIAGNTEPKKYKNYHTSFILRKKLIQPLKDYSYQTETDFFTFDASNFVIERDFFLKHQFCKSPRFEDQIFYLHLSRESNFSGIFLNSNNVLKVINESIFKMFYNIILHNFCTTDYFLKKNIFMNEFLRFAKSTSVVIFTILNISLPQKISIQLFSLFSLTIQFISYLYLDIRRILFKIVFMVFSLLVFTLYLPDLNIKHFLAKHFNSLPMLHVSFWSMYSEKGLYFTRFYYRCKPEQLWKKIDYKKSNFIEYKKQIIRNIYPYILVTERPEIIRKIVAHESNRCLNNRSNFELKVDFTKHIKNGDIIVFDKKIYKL